MILSFRETGPAEAPEVTTHIDVGPTDGRFSIYPLRDSRNGLLQILMEVPRLCSYGSYALTHDCYLAHHLQREYPPSTRISSIHMARRLFKLDVGGAEFRRLEFPVTRDPNPSNYQ